MWSLPCKCGLGVDRPHPSSFELDAAFWAMPPPVPVLASDRGCPEQRCDSAVCGRWPSNNAVEPPRPCR